MKILILSHALRVAGARVVGINLLKTLKAIDARNEYYLVVPDQPEYRSLKLEDSRHEVYYYRRRLSHLGRWFFDKFTLKRIVKTFEPDVILGLGNQGILAPPCPQAILLHHPLLVYDLKKTGKMALLDSLKVFFLKRYFRQQLKATGVVFCQTATMEKRLRSMYEYKGKTVVTENVVSTFSALKPSGKLPAPLVPYKDKHILFYLTRYYPHKGIEILVETMDKYRDDLSDAVAVITIAPDQHKNAKRLLDQIKKRGLEDRIINVGPLKQAELADYYAAADCLVMPTRLESFSGTYLEAMHFKLPILTSDLDFAREVCQDAALYFDPWNAESIKNTILRIKNDLGLKNELVERGQARLSKGFGRSWEDVAKDMLYHVESLVSEGEVK